ncbi:unnamed protein product [Diamesa serratosioi]
MDFEEFRVHGKQMVDYICDYVKDLDKRQVAPTIDPGYLTTLLPTEIPVKPESYDQIMEDFEKKVMPGMMHWNHPNFFAYFPTGNAYPSILGEMLSAGVGALGFSWASCPALTEMETIMLDWYAKALDLPESFLSKNSIPNSIGGGAMQGSASDAIFVCMMAARARAIKQLKGENHEIHDSVYLPQLVAYASAEAHSSIEKAAKMNYVKLRVIEPDSHDSMRGDALEKAVERDIARGLTPFLVVATVGTTSQVSFDNLTEIGLVCKKYPTMWMHVDGAYGGNSFIVPEMRKFKIGMEYADSFNTNPNKLLMTSFDASCMWVKNILMLTAAFAVDPLYLQHQHENTAVDLRHYGTSLSRRFRSLKLWFMFRMYGLVGLQRYVRNVIAVGKHMEQLVKSDDRFEVRNDVFLGLVCFRLNQPDAVNQEFLARMNSSGKIHLTPAKVKGKFVIRFVAGQEHANNAQIDKAWKTILEFAVDVLKELAPKKADLKPRVSIKKARLYTFTQNLSQELFEKQYSI